MVLDRRPAPSPKGGRWGSLVRTKPVHGIFFTLGLDFRLRCVILSAWYGIVPASYSVLLQLGDNIMAKIASKVVGESFVRFEFADGDYMQCDISKLSQDMLVKLALHGISQKVGDSYASAESVKEAKINAKAVWDNLSAGVWAVRAVKGGKIVEALSRATGQPYDVCLEKYASMTDEQKKDLRKHKDIKLALAEIEAERAAALAESAGDDDESLTALFN